jgi:conjugative relaxase-like TrwC/TraI family protein
MVSKTTCTNKAGALAYFKSHLSTADYFMAPDAPKQGVWVGRLAAAVGLEGAAVSPVGFERWLSGDLREIGTAADPAIDHDRLKRARASELLYTEFTYTAPKPVSVAAALDDRLKTCIMEAVTEELRWFESAAAVRDRRGVLANAEVTRPTGNFMAALFPHETSRTNDPNFHVHGLIGNMTWDNERRELLALHFGDMLELRKTLDARIHNNLAARAASLGYTVEVAQNGFGLREVPVEAVELFSIRHRQVATARQLLQEGHSVQSLRDTVETLRQSGRAHLMESYADMKRLLGPPDGKPMADLPAEETAVLLTRPPKTEISAETLTAETKARLQRAGLSVLIPPPGAAPVKPAVDLPLVLNQALAAAFDHEAVVRLDELIGNAARLAPGAVTNQEFGALLRADPRLVVGRMGVEGRENGVDLVTTRALVAQEIQLLEDVRAGFGARIPAVSPTAYTPPPALTATPERTAEILTAAARRGETLTADQVGTWLRQFEGIHRYVSTSSDQFLNIRGGAGVGKTFCMELLVRDSLAAGRAVVLTAPYGEQSRVTMRAEAPRLAAEGKAEAAAAFENANTVASLLQRVLGNPPFRESLTNADIFVDEAGLLDTPTAAALARLARETGARLILQGDTEQKLAVGRGSPLVALQERLGLGMKVERAAISRRQLRGEDKRLAADLSSGDSTRFQAALDRFEQRGDLRQAPPVEAIGLAASRALEARAAGQDLLLFSSVHRLCSAISQEIHRQRMESTPGLPTVIIDTLKPLGLTPPEMRSSQSYYVGQTIAYGHQGRTRLSRVVSVNNGVVKIETGSLTSKLNLERVTEIYTKTSIERSTGAVMVLTEKIKVPGKIHERNSRHRLTAIDGQQLTFDTGLKLSANDGRLAQGDVLTVDKSQGAKGKHVMWIEDNRSLTAMGNRRDVHVGFTRHVEKLGVLVESIDLFRKTAARERAKLSALELAEKAAPTVWQPVEERSQKTAAPLPFPPSQSLAESQSSPAPAAKAAPAPSSRPARLEQPPRIVSPTPSRIHPPKPAPAQAAANRTRQTRLATILRWAASKMRPHLKASSLR